MTTELDEARAWIASLMTHMEDNWRGIDDGPIQRARAYLLRQGPAPCPGCHGDGSKQRPYQIACAFERHAGPFRDEQIAAAPAFVANHGWRCKHGMTLGQPCKLCGGTAYLLSAAQS